MFVLQLGEGNKTYFALVQASVWLVHLWDWFMEPIHTCHGPPDTNLLLAHSTAERHKFGINPLDPPKNRRFGQEAFFHVSWWERAWLLDENLSVRSFSPESLSWDCREWAGSPALRAGSSAGPELQGGLAPTPLAAPGPPRRATGTLVRKLEQRRAWKFNAGRKIRSR